MHDGGRENGRWVSGIETATRESLTNLSSTGNGGREPVV